VVVLFVIEQNKIGAVFFLVIFFGKPTAALRKALLEESRLFVGSSSNPNVVRILPPLNCTKEEISNLLSEIKRLS
jgi:acetylornithine aminotransferase